MLNRGIFGVELRSFWCGSEGFWGLKRSGPLCGTDHTSGGCETEWDPLIFYIIESYFEKCMIFLAKM